MIYRWYWEAVIFKKLLEIHQGSAKIRNLWCRKGERWASIRPELQPEITFYAIWEYVSAIEENASVQWSLKVR